MGSGSTQAHHVGSSRRGRPLTLVVSGRADRHGRRQKRDSGLGELAQECNLIPTQQPTIIAVLTATARFDPRPARCDRQAPVRSALAILGLFPRCTFRIDRPLVT